MVIFFEVHNFY